MRKLKVCFLIAGFGQGGAQKQCIALMNELQNHPEIDLHLIYFYEEVNFSFLEQKNISLHKISVGSLYDPRNIFKIGKVLNRITPEILFSWLHACDVYVFFARKFVPSCKWIMAERDSYYPVDPRYTLRSYLGVTADMIVCNSNQGREYWLKNKAASKKIQVISNILIQQNGKVLSGLRGKPTVMYAGRLEPQKNVIHLAEVFCEMAERHPDGNFFIIGNGSLEDKIRDKIDSLGKNDQVKVLPFQKNIIDYFHTTDVFVNLSLHEGMPNTIIENIALGTKLVVSDIDEHRNLLGQGYPYYVNDVGNSVEAVNVLEKVLVCSDMAERLCYAKARLEHMEAGKIVDQYVRIFYEVIND